MAGRLAKVLIELEPADAGTWVTIREDAVAGPGSLPWPVRQLSVVARNRETLRRLRFLSQHSD